MRAGAELAIDGPTCASATRRCKRDAVRWYLVRAPEGQEQATCEKVRQLVPADVLDDAFVMRKERWFKQGGVWSLRCVDMYRGYFFVATRDVQALDRAMRGLSFPAKVEGAAGQVQVPMAADVQAWYEKALDDQHVLRNSVAAVVDGTLRVQAGPLVGQESRVRKVDRHRRQALVGVSLSDEGMTQTVAIDVPFKS